MSNVDETCSPTWNLVSEIRSWQILEVWKLKALISQVNALLKKRKKYLTYLQNIFLTISRPLACDFEKSCYLAIIKALGIPLSFSYLANFHRQIIWALLIAHLKTRQLWVTNWELISFPKVISDRLESTLFINWESAHKKGPVDLILLFSFYMMIPAPFPTALYIYEITD
jgi:hypothetical protein